MSTDFEDPQLDELLAGYARSWNAGFTAPPLAGMLEQATSRPGHRRRWLLPAVAAALLLAIPLITVLLVRHGRTAEQPAQPLPNTKPVLVGPVPWRDPVWTGNSIWFVARVSPSQYCKGVASIHADVTEDGAASVTIVASLYTNPDRSAMTELQKEMCSNPSPDSSGEVGISSSVDLPEPLAGRSAFDGMAHLAHKVLDARMITSIPALPPIFHDFAYSGVTDTNMVSHDWVLDNLRDGVSLSAVPIDSPTGSSWLHQGTPSTIGLVNGHQTRLGPGQHTITWENGAYVYQIVETSEGGDYHRLSLTQLLDLARSVP
ncbi:MAG TPA: hypothetical protein VH298_15590 [Jatrophihabitans sp.]|jgi:hypothetical protein|nr:hypothetical protein [Jatrophihabitans sp.]